MLEFLKKIFCAAEPTETPVPYKVEAPKVESTPVKNTDKVVKPTAEKKPATKSKTLRKPRASKA